MMLSTKATRYLRFLSKTKDYRSYVQMEQDYKGFDEQQFWAIYNAGFFEFKEPYALPQNQTDRKRYLIGSVEFRINDAGFAYLESVAGQLWTDVRAWIAIALSVISLILSIISIISG